jgi:hypothetical protein
VGKTDVGWHVDHLPGHRKPAFAANDRPSDGVVVRLKLPAESLPLVVEGGIVIIDD